jgi:hypothetical protein
MRFDNLLIRASSVGCLMTEPRSKVDREAGNLSETAKSHLIEVYVSAKYNRSADIQSRYIRKGLLVEEDSLTLYSRYKRKFFKKNETRLTNEFIQGCPDSFIGDTISNASEILEIKSSWDIYTFFKNLSKEINDQYYWQCQGYLALTGAKTSTLAYCLIDTPLVMIEDEKRKLMWKMGVATSEESEYKEAAEELERLMTYGDIPLNEKVIEFQIERNQEDIDLMYTKSEKGAAVVKRI